MEFNFLGNEGRKSCWDSSDLDEFKKYIQIKNIKPLYFNKILISGSRCYRRTGNEFLICKYLLAEDSRCLLLDRYVKDFISVCDNLSIKGNVNYESTKSQYLKANTLSDFATDTD